MGTLGGYGGPSFGDSCSRPDDRGCVKVGYLDRCHRQAPEAPIGSDEIRHEGRGGMAEHLGRAVVLLQSASLAHHRDPVAHDDRLIDIVRHEHDRFMEPFLESEELLLEPASGYRVDGTERLVHEEDGWVSGQSPGDADPLGLPA